MHSKKKFIPTSQWRGATWQPRTGPHGTTLLIHLYAKCQIHIFPVVHINCPISVLTIPCHMSYGHATCHPYSGDTCHSLIGPHHESIRPVTLPHVSAYAQSPYHVSVHMLSKHTKPAIVPCHVSCMVVRPVQSAATWHCTNCTIIFFFLFG
jgi:hypothetical protein